MLNTVITYYAEISSFRGSTNNRELLELWEKNWKSQGWDPVVLTQEDAQAHEQAGFIRDFDPTSPLLQSSPHDKVYLWNCYLRWFAYCRFVEKNGGCLWSDFDVMNCNLTPEQLQTRNILPNTAFNGSFCSGILSLKGTKDLIEAFKSVYDQCPETMSKIQEILTLRPNTDVNDMIVLTALKLFKIMPICTNFKLNEVPPFDDGVYNKKRYPLMHFHHGIFQKEDINALKPLKITTRSRTCVIKQFFNQYLNQNI